MVRMIPVVDLAFLFVDRADAPANIGILLVFEPPAGTSADKAVRDIVRAYRAQQPTSPLDVVPEAPIVGVPHWTSPADVDMARHVVRETLPAPGSMAQLNERIAELHRERLDRNRPLFQVHLIDGLESGCFAMYIKSHHVTWDGRSASARIFASLSTKPGPLLPGFHALPPGPPPTGTADLASGLRSFAAHALAFREIYSRLSRRIAAAGADADRARGNAPFAGPSTRLNQRVTAARSFAGFSLPLEEMRRVGRAFGGSINDVLLAVTDAGAQRYLHGLGERPPGPLVAMCPVSVRDPGDHEFGTKASTLFVKLGNPRSAPGRRLGEIVASTGRAKSEFRSMSKQASLDFALLAFGLWLASDVCGLGAYTHPIVNFVVSNVGGIEGPRYLGRSRLVGAYPVSMVADPAGLNFTSFSQGGRMDVGIVANRTAVPDASVIAGHCLAAWQQLSDAEPPQGLSLRKPPARRLSRTRRIPASQRA